jgi:heme o synthase
MKSTTRILTPVGALSDERRWKDYWEMTKPRLSLMSVTTAILGYFAAGPQTDLVLFAALVAGTTLAAFGAAVLNQWWERDIDARMPRTADRPVAAGRVRPIVALNYGLALSFGGVLILGLWVNLAAAILAAATVALYILAYTPLKRTTPWATEVGALPGALPPLIGWVAAGAGFSALGWVLFAVLFAWQLPHFMAIAWMCREQYNGAGFRLLVAYDSTGIRVARRALVWTLVLVAASLLPLRDPAFGWLLGAAAVILGGLMLVPAVQFWRCAGDRLPAARTLFFASLAYLPLYLAALVADRFFV